MALIKCFECGKEVSNTAKQCPHCGFEIKKKLDELKAGKGCAILIVGLAILIFFIIVVSSKEEKNESVKIEKSGNHCINNLDGSNSQLMQYVEKEHSKDHFMVLTSFRNKRTAIQPVKNGKHFIKMYYFYSFFGLDGKVIGEITAYLDHKTCNVVSVEYFDKEE